MTKFRIFALCAALLSVPAFAQVTQGEQEEVTYIDTHWTMSEREHLIENAPFIRPRHRWELMNAFKYAPANTERVVLEALTHAIEENGKAFIKHRADMIAFYRARAAGEVVDRPVIVVVTPGTGEQRMVGAMEVGRVLDNQDVYEYLLAQLDPSDRTTFIDFWDGATSRQREAIVDIVKNSAEYFNWRTMYGY